MSANTVNVWRGIESKKSLAREALDWQQHAACIGEPLSTFFPEGPAEEFFTEDRFRQLCGDCPVATECRDYSINQPERYGRWGALNEDERASERRRRMRKGQVPIRRGASKRTEQRKKMTPRRQMVSAVGSTRRLQAASAEGRILRSYAQLSGVPETTLSKIRAGTRSLISPSDAKAIADAYPKVLALVHQVHRVPLQTAAERGWHGPDAWTEASIDDPAAVPRMHETAA